MGPIRLLVVDIDGCLVPTNHASYDLPKLDRLAQMNRESRTDPTIPPLTILSGRPHPYVDALMQMLDIELPAVFENGAGLAIRRPYGARYRQEVERGRADLATLEGAVSEERDMVVQPGKSASLTVFPADSGDGIGYLQDRLGHLIQSRGLGLHVDPSHECVNILIRGVDKGLGLSWLAQETGNSCEQMAGIGDSVGDLPWLRLCGLSGAPANAERGVREAVDLTFSGNDVDATIELYERVVAHNRSL